MTICATDDVYDAIDALTQKKEVVGKIELFGDTIKFIQNGSTTSLKDIYILQCTKLKIGCLICKYRVFSLKIHIQGKIQVIQSQPQWLAFFIFFENFSENSAKSGFVW